MYLWIIWFQWKAKNNIFFLFSGTYTKKKTPQNPQNQHIKLKQLNTLQSLKIYLEQELNHSYTIITMSFNSHINYKWYSLQYTTKYMYYILQVILVSFYRIALCPGFQWKFACKLCVFSDCRCCCFTLDTI